MWRLPTYFDNRVTTKKQTSPLERRTDDHPNENPEPARQPADPRAGQARRRMDKLHVPLYLRRRLPPLQTWHRRRHPGWHRLRVRHQPDVVDRVPRGDRDPGPDGRTLNGAPRPGEPHHEPSRGIALHPRHGVQRSRGILGLGVLLRPLHRNRGAAPGLHPALRLDMAAHIKNLAVKNNMRVHGVQYSLKNAP